MRDKLKTKLAFYWSLIPILLKQPRYIKYIFSWRRRPLASQVTWVNFATKEWLDKNLHKDMVVFEYGSGGSTLYYAQKVKKIISVEHDRAWQETVKSRLLKKAISNFTLYYCPPEEINGPGDNFYASSDEHYPHKSFRKYVEKINDYPDNFFDLVAVDGRSRNACLNDVWLKVKNGGYVLLDNSDRAEYNPGLKRLERFAVKIFFGPGFYDNGQWEARLWQIKK